MEDIQSLNSENHQTGAIVKKQQSNVQNTKIPLKDSLNNNKAKGSNQQTVKKHATGSEKQLEDYEEVECFQAAKNGMCHCNGPNRGSIGSNFYDLTPTPEFMHFMDVTSNPSKMYHLLMNDPNYAALFNERDPMEELHEPVELPKRPVSPVAEIEEDQEEFDITPLPIEDFDIPLLPEDDIDRKSSEEQESLAMKNAESSEQ